MTKWKPRDVIALVLLIGALFLRGFGVDSVTAYILIGIASSYLGISFVEYRASKQPPVSH